MIWTILTLNESTQWNALLAELPLDQQDIYFTPEYYKLYKEYGDGEPYCFVFQNNEGLALYPFLKNKINNSNYLFDAEYFDIQGAYGYNGVASNNYSENFKEEFKNSFQNYCTNENIVAEFSRFHPLLKNHLFSEKYMSIIKDRQTVLLDLSCDYDSIWNDSYSSNNRNMIRKAQRNEINVRIAKNDTDYELFHQIYISTMLEVGAAAYYHFNKEYVHNFNKALVSKQLLLIAEYQEKPICVMLMMIYGRYAHYHLSGRIKDYSNLAANNFILDSAIQIAREHGARFFHFGGGNSSDPNDPLFKFKSNFSKDLTDFYIGKKVHNQEIYNRICKKWEQNNPDKKDKYAKFLLKYRQ